ncbi:MAG: molybdopterin-dependent oxidoreductase, partial [Eggerthellaceae bacterium]|nr:molybdopterin-dependent oxidoreductase [Eggerthellaceae bacterium]
MAYEERLEEAAVNKADGFRDLITGDWVPAACWHNCGGRCVNKVLVRDGIVIRQKTDDSVEDTPDNPQQRGCVRGRSQRMQVFGPDRIKYPLKRKGWSPDAPNGHLRGRDEWERISWDEALSYVAAELKKAYGTYGPRSVLNCATKGLVNVLNAMGGACTVTDTSSCGTLSNGTAAKMGLGFLDWFFVVNDRYDLKNAEYIVLHGANPAWTASGMPINNYLAAKKAGAKYVVVGPFKNASANLLDAKWIPVRPSTDLAFVMGVAYEMLQLDEKQGGIIDWDFLHTYTVGFDADSMPEGAATPENYRAYLLGEYDGVPKTAEWASEICGAPVEDIRWFAEICGKQHATMLLHGFAPVRALGSEDFTQAFIALGAMGGHFGKPGHACGGIREQTSGNDGPRLVSAGDAGAVPPPPPTIYDPIPAVTVWQSILDKKYRYVGTMYAELAPGEERDLDIHVICFEAAGTMRTAPNTAKAIEAVRSVDFVFASQYVMNTQAYYADIVLPCTTEWETPGGFPNANRETLIMYRQVVEPLYEAKTDFDIAKALAVKLGLDAEALFAVDLKQQFMNQILGATYLDATYQPQPLIAVTQEDLDAWGCVGEPHDGVVTLAEMWENGVYHVPRAEGDAFGFIGYAQFVADPVANPVGSASGKIELYCQAKADEFNAPGAPGVAPVKAYPTYRTPPVGFETLTEEYPFLAYNPHYYRRTHSCLDNVLWDREAWASPVYLNPVDAEAKGIADGDTVVVSSPAGKVLRPATVLASVMPGVV